jgi:sugar/nucleoside kinase (ribokinase family)
MAILVVGSVALDTLTTPAGKVEDALGGSAVYFALAACPLDSVRVVGVVGPDFPRTEMEFLTSRNIDLTGLVTGQGPTFRWEGVYGPDFGDARTLRTELGVFAGFEPRLPESYRETPCVFLANIDPELQLRVMDQISSPRWVAMDTMNLWIDRRRELVLEAMGRVDILLVNASEARQVSGSSNLFEAGRFLLSRGPRFVVVKMGAQGAMVLGGTAPFIMPAVPVEKVIDPTGAGDSFAAGMLAYLSGSKAELTLRNIARAMCYGSVTAGFAIEGFGVEGLRSLDSRAVSERLAYYLSTNQLDRIE